MTRNRNGRYLLEAGVVGACCYATGLLGLAVALPPGDACPIWPLGGVALAAMLRLGYRVWPGILVGAVLAGATVRLSLPSLLLMGLINTGRTLLAAWLTRRWAGDLEAHNRGSAALRFAAAAGVASALAGLVGALGGVAQGEVAGAEFWACLVTWCLGDAVGMLVMTPWLLAWSRPSGHRLPLVRWAEAGGLLGLMAVCIWALFGLGARHGIMEQMPYLLSVFVCWAVVRFGMRMTSTAILGLTGMSVWFTMQGLGPFVHASHHSPVLEQQVFTALTALGGLGLFAVVNRRRQSEAALRQARDELEGRVQERTAQLQKAKEQLERDVAELQQMQAQLDTSEQQFLELAENIQEVFWVIAPDRSRVFYVSRAYETVWGRPRARLYAHPEGWAETIHPDDRPRVTGPALPLAATGPIEVEYRVLRPDGTIRWVHDRAFPVKDRAGRLSRLAGVAVDITEAKQAEAVLREKEALYHSLVENLPQNIFRKDLSGRFTFANQRFCQAVGRSLEQLVNRTDFDLFPPELARKYQTDDRRVIELGLTYETVEEHQLPGGPKLFVQVVKTPLRDAAGKIVGVQGIFWDITANKRAEEALRESQANLAAAQRITHLGSWEAVLTDPSDLSQNTLRWSDEVFRIFGYEPGRIEVTRERFFQAVHPDDRALVDRAVTEALRDRKAYQVDHRVVRPDGSIRFVHEHAEIVGGQKDDRPLKLVGTVQDTTDRQQMEDQLRQAQKMEAIGQLAGGVAHDFNNILTVIKGHLGLLLGGANLTPPMIESLKEVEAASSRAANLTRQLLTFSRQQVLRMKRLDLNEIVANIYNMLHRLLGEHIVLQCNYGPELSAVEADAGMIEQVIMNLAVNARDAMPKGGRLTLSTTVEEVGPAYVKRNPDAKPGRYVVLAVSDTGCGMDEATLGRVFEPFFTTKEVGKGTGLGLATVYGIVKQHQGWVEVASQPDRGACFKVFLPACAKIEATAAARLSAEEPPGGHETILLVEDERPVRILARVCLRRHGYRVLESANGVEALRLWKEQRGRIDLLLTDMVMPEGMTGRELAEHLKVENPKLKVLFTSGYSLDVIGGDLDLVEGANYLPKPYDPGTLARTVRRCLDWR